MPTYLFLFGNTPELSRAELVSVLPTGTVISDLAIMDAHLARVELDSADQARQLMSILGGTVKIFEEITTTTEVDNETLTKLIVTQLAQRDRVFFAIAELGRDHLPALSAADIKDFLESQGITTRYAEGSRHGLSAAVLLHKKRVEEITIIQTTGQVLLAQTVAVQDIDAWSDRDRGKPYANRKKGMLPPKVARMMVNLALGDSPDFSLQTSDTPTVLDPFCGSGTILMEAMVRGCQAIGSDLDQEAVQGSENNLRWLAERYELATPYSTHYHDATQAVTFLPNKIQYLVTEPFLGKPKPNPQQLQNIFKGLERLYLGAFKQWTRILAPGAKLVIVFPQAVIAGRKTPFTLEALIDKLALIGYTTTSQPLLYHRPQAMIQRQIYQFVYQPTEK